MRKVAQKRIARLREACLTLGGFMKEIVRSLPRVLYGPVRLRATAIMLVAGLWSITGFFAVSGFAFAQNTNATIRGQVLDPSGALVPSATGP